MQQYLGTKLILGKLMTLGQYNKYRGWEIPSNEDPAKTGYLVEYPDYENPNHENHKGYISWSPTAPFEDAYVLVNDDDVIRFLDEHMVNPANDTIQIKVMDEAGHGGACHEYLVSHPKLGLIRINFQNGPINVDGNGVNGLTHEILLAILADRLRSFQAGEYACEENACALTHIEKAQMWLQHRTMKRMCRGVEGTHKK